MCSNCGDYVGMCGLGDCYNPDGGSHGKYRKFYINDTYCEHMKARFGHDIAVWTDIDSEEEE